MQSEIAQLNKIGTWDVILWSEAEETSHVLPSTWTLHCKQYPNGSFQSHKDCFCVQGDKQVEGLDYGETYAPVVAWSTVRLLLVLSVVLGLETLQVD